MKKIGELRSILPKEIYPNVRELLDAYVYGKCDYLCISYEAWEKLFIRIVSALVSTMNDKSFNYFMGKVVESVNRTICNLINRNIKEGKIYILDNLFIKLKREGYRDERLLAMFLLELNCLYVDFTEAVFNLLKDNSKKFNTILSAVGFKSLSYEEFVTILNKKYKLNIKVIKEDEIDYNEIVQKYANMTYEEIKGLFGDIISELPQQNVNLLQRYFAKPVLDDLFFPYEAEKEVNLLLTNYKRKNINLEMKDLRKAYLENKDKFSQKQALYLECFILELKDKNEFIKAYPDGGRITKCDLISKLEKLYYGIDNLFDASLSKEQYLEVLKRYPGEATRFRSDILNYYYGVNGKPLSIKEISEFFNINYDEMKRLIISCRDYCLSLYSNINNSHTIDKSLYIPYVLDERYDLNHNERTALKLFLIDGKSYEEIAKDVKGKVSTIISEGLQKIDEYRFGINRLNPLVENENIEVTEKDILEEINRHPSESVINTQDKKFLSYFLGLKTPFNIMGEKLRGQALQEKLEFKSKVKVKAKYDDLIKKIQQRKLGILLPELIIIPREELVNILDDCHLPISDEDRYIICSLLEIRGLSLKSFEELAQELDVASKSIKRKYKLAIVNIKKYLLGEKEGIIDYEFDVVPNLRYFTLKEREVIYDHYVVKLTNMQIAEKYGISKSLVSRLMYRIKTYLADIIKNPDAVRFDYDYYHQVVDMPDFPFRGNLEQAKRIFDLYVGETTIGRANIEEIKNILGLTMPYNTIKRVIDNLVLCVFKYKDGIRKENGFTLNEVREFYEQNKNNFSSGQLNLFVNFFSKNAYVDYKMSEDLIFLMMKGKKINSFDISKASKEEILRLLRNHLYKFTKKAKGILMHYGNILERDLMSGSEINHVFRILNDLDRRLPKNEAMNRARKI